MRKLPVSIKTVRLVAVSFILGILLFARLSGYPVSVGLIAYLAGLAVWLEVAVRLANGGPPQWYMQWLVSSVTLSFLCGAVWLILDIVAYGPVVLVVYLVVAAMRLGLGGGLYISALASAFMAWVTQVRPDKMVPSGWFVLTLSLAAISWLVQQYRVQSLAGFMDQLTQVYNRRGLDQYMRERLHTYKQAVVVLCDLDGLKQVNDTMGHAAGDHALVQASKALLRHLRASDFVCRLGGDEFLILMTEVGINSAEQVLDAIRQDIQINAGLTASFGVALYPRDGGNLRDVMAAADEAVYQAKRKRNSVAFTRAAGE